MKAFVRLWQYRAELFLELEIFRTESAVKTHILCSITCCEITWKIVVQRDTPQSHVNVA